jgi:CheY-specific phosphatase CheX
MTETESILESLANEVLETMFFSAVLGPGEADPTTPMLTALVSFSGSRAGTLGVSASEATAVALAANFLGGVEESVPAEQVPPVLGELANVLCGAVLGRVEPAGRFTISPPQVSAGPEAAVAVSEMQARCTFELMEGGLTAGLTIV